MNREIKFKTIIEYKNGRTEYFILYPFNEELNDEKGNDMMPLGAKHLAIGLQYTGLKDKNGKEIYEGDIIKAGEDGLMTIGWDEKFASFVIDKKGWAFRHYFGEAINPQNCEVIGNIYENPELLK